MRNLISVSVLVLLSSLLGGCTAVTRYTNLGDVPGPGIIKETTRVVDPDGGIRTTEKVSEKSEAQLNFELKKEGLKGHTQMGVAESNRPVIYGDPYYGYPRFSYGRRHYDRGREFHGMGGMSLDPRHRGGGAHRHCYRDKKGRRVCR